jgi:hypothetical protein
MVQIRGDDSTVPWIRFRINMGTRPFNQGVSSRNSYFSFVMRRIQKSEAGIQKKIKNLVAGSS